MSRKLATLGDFNKDKDDDKDKKKSSSNNSKPAPNTYYAGSGQSIIGPGGNSNSSNSSSSSSSSSSNQGGAIIDKIMSQQGVSGASSGAVTIRFWKNGFTVDDGELRLFTDPANKAFLDSINNGELPAELRSRHRSHGDDLDVSVEDHRSEDYKEPAYRAFGGTGATIGGNAKPTVGIVTGSSSSGSRTIQVNETEPTTTIQVKLANGKREKIILNLNHTVGDLQAKVASFQATNGRPFTLTAGFPPKILSDATSTIDAAGLKNAAVTQTAQ